MCVWSESAAIRSGRGESLRKAQSVLNRDLRDAISELENQHNGCVMHVEGRMPPVSPVYHVDYKKNPLGLRNDKTNVKFEATVGPAVIEVTFLLCSPVVGKFHQGGTVGVEDSFYKEVTNDALLLTGMNNALSGTPILGANDARFQ